MPLQLGFDGSVKSIGKDSIPDVLRLTLDRYRQYVEKLAHPLTPDNVYWRIVFAILSVHTAFEPNVLAYELLRSRGMPKRWQTLTRWLAGVKSKDGAVIQFQGQKARYVLDFTASYQVEPTQFCPNGDGSTGWRDRLMKIRGLARTKASFAVCLADPLGSEVVCIDRHMARLLLGKAPKAISRKEYDACESEILALAKGYNAPPFAIQWCLWDAQRGRIETHEVLAEP